MKNILLLTSLYPSDDIKILNNTAVCHYFAKEWVKMGYNVRVVFCYHCYPDYFYPFLKIASKTLANKTGISVMYINSKETHDYEMDGIRISRIPTRKNRPGGSFPNKEIKKVSKEILESLGNEGFVPDIILGHFLHPAIDIICSLKEHFPNAKTAVSIHGKEEGYEKHTQELLKAIDYLGYRSVPIKRVFESYYGEHPYFMCPSGVPQEYIISEARDFKKVARNFVYVGSFVKRKYPSVLVPAIDCVYQDKQYSITYVGDGNGKDLIEREIKRAHAEKQVTFTGRLNREDVKSQLDKADVFIMISRLETFGLVYLEAMSRGCIVVASKDEGMEGIIEHGVNGFLCEAGNVGDLKSVVQTIKNLSIKELNTISEAGRQTALRMTDKIVAKEYIQKIEI